MSTRRDFLKTGAAVGGAGLIASGCSKVLHGAPKYFGLHPFIEKNPGAVFIKKTAVSTKFDSEAKKREGLSFAREVFVLKAENGIPITHGIVIKPNLTASINENYPFEAGMGIITDPYFVEGIILGMKEKTGAKEYHLIQCNSPQFFSKRGYTQMAERVGATLRTIDPDITKAKPDDFNYVDVPDGIVYKRIPYVAPTNEPKTWLMNIAKWKAHGMGITQCCKNLQGLVGPMYGNFCRALGSIKTYPDYVLKDFRAGYEERIRASYERHLKEGYHRWDVTKGLNALTMETWCHRTLDNMSVTPTGFSVIEGIYARDGNGFHIGTDYMTNTLIFGMDNFRVDVVGLWLGGHEPGNFGFHRIAVERGLADTINPWEIPIYEWVDGQPVQKKLTDFERIPIKTYYLQREGEERFHLVNEPFDYEKVT